MAACVCFWKASLASHLQGSSTTSTFTSSPGQSKFHISITDQHKIKSYAQRIPPSLNLSQHISQPGCSSTTNAHTFMSGQITDILWHLLHKHMPGYQHMTHTNIQILLTHLCSLAGETHSEAGAICMATTETHCYGNVAGTLKQLSKCYPLVVQQREKSTVKQRVRGYAPVGCDVVKHCYLCSA